MVAPQIHRGCTVQETKNAKSVLRMSKVWHGLGLGRVGSRLGFDQDTFRSVLSWLLLDLSICCKCGRNDGKE